MLNGLTPHFGSSICTLKVLVKSRKLFTGKVKVSGLIQIDKSGVIYEVVREESLTAMP